MRPTTGLLALVPILLLAACDSNTPPAQQGNAPAAPAATAPAAPRAPTTSALPVGARPLLGTWSEALDRCGDSAATTSVTATNYTSPARSCPMNLTASGDGFALNCGGSAMSLVPVFAPTGEGIRVTVGDGKPVTLLRCTR